MHAPHGHVGPATAYGRRSGPCEALRAPLPSTDALDTLFTLRAASQRRVPTAKALAEPLLERCKPLLGAGGAVLGRCRPCCSLPSAQFRPKTPRFRRFRLQRLHTFLTNSRFHIIYSAFHRDFIETSLKYVQKVEIHEVSVIDVILECMFSRTHLFSGNTSIYRNLIESCEITR